MMYFAIVYTHRRVKIKVFPEPQGL